MHLYRYSAGQSWSAVFGIIAGVYVVGAVAWWGCTRCNPVDP
jgi:hypothetical protein